MLTLACVVASVGAVPGSVQAAPAQQPAAPSQAIEIRVIEREGRVKWRSSSATPWKDAKQAEINDVLPPGSEVSTGAKARCTLNFVLKGWKAGETPHATAVVDSNSDFSIPTCELVQEADGDVFKAIAKIQVGTTGIKVNRISARNDFNVVVPDGTLAVRGTGFTINTGPMGGTEVTGVPGNAIAAIQLKYAAISTPVVLSGGGGEAKSSSETPEPATNSLVTSIGAPPVAGTVASAAEAFQSAVVGTTQAPVIQQITATVAGVAQTAAEASSVQSGQDGSSSGNGVLALFADLNRTAERVADAAAGADGTASRLATAAQALLAAQVALSDTRDRILDFQVAEQAVLDASSDVGVLLELTLQASAASEASRADSLDAARAAFDSFSDQDGAGSGDFADLAAVRAASAASSASEASFGADVADQVLQVTLDRLALAIAARGNVDAAAGRAGDAGAAAEQALNEGTAFRDLVVAAIADIESIFSRRPLDGIRSGLLVALDRLVVAEERLLAAQPLRDEAIQAALTAQEEAAGAVLAAAELAAQEAADRAQAANDSAAAAVAATADLGQGIESLTAAIGAMLSARDEREGADAERAAAEALREVASARAAEAQAQIDVHIAAAQGASDAAVAASTALAEALGHLDQAFENAGITSTAVENCLAALQEAQPDLGAAGGFAVEARQAAEATQGNALDARSASDRAGEAADSALATGQESIGAGSVYAQRIAAIRQVIVNAQDRAEAAAGHALDASTAAVSAESSGSAFAAQFADPLDPQSSASAAAAAALNAVARALTIAAEAQDFADQAVASVGGAQAALDSVLDPFGAEVDFTSSEEDIETAVSSAAQASDAAGEAEQLAAVADAEAATAEAAVDAASGAGFAAAFASAAAVRADESNRLASDALDILDQLDQGSQELEEQIGLAQAAADDASSAQSGLSQLLTAFDAEMAALLSAIDERSLATAESVLAEVGGASDDANVAEFVNAATESASTALAAAQAAETFALPLSEQFALAQDLAAQAGVEAGAAATEADQASAAAASAAAATGAAGTFANLAQLGGSDLGDALDLLVARSAAFADAAATSASEAGSAASAAADATDGLGVRIGSFALASSAPALQAAQSALDSLQSVLGAADRRSSTLDAAAATVFTLELSLEASDIANGLVLGAESIGDASADFNFFVEAHEGVSLTALERVADARAELGGATESRESAQAHFQGLESAFDEMLFALQGQGSLMIPDPEAGAALAMQVGALSGEVMAAVESAQIATASAQGFAEQGGALAQDGLSLEIAARAIDLAVGGATGTGGAVGDLQAGTSVVQGLADAAVHAAAVAQNAAEGAGSSVALALADRAALLAGEAIARALDATNRLQIASAQADQMRQTVSQQNWNAAAQAVAALGGEVGAAEQQLQQAQFTALQASQYGALAQVAVGSVFEARAAAEAAEETEFSHMGAVSARGAAAVAIANHDSALAAVDGLVSSSAVTLETAWDQSDIAVFESGVANIRFIDTQAAFQSGDLNGAAQNARDSLNAANASTDAAGLSNEAAVATRTFGDQAIVHAEQSALAAQQYVGAVSQADSFAASAVQSFGDADGAAERSSGFAEAAAALAAQLGTLRAGSASDIAAAARDHAVLQAQQAAQSRDSALAAAQSARFMGERVFFTVTAERAALVVQRANEARVAADIATAAADRAQSDAAAAAALVGQSGGGIVISDGGPGGGPGGDAGGQ